MNTAVGQTRAYAFARNAPLPEAGSFQEQVLAEVILRERNAKYAEVMLFARLLGGGLGVSNTVLDGLLDVYKEELYQLRYNSKYVTAGVQRKKKIRDEAVRQAQLMARIDAMTVEDSADG